MYEDAFVRVNLQLLRQGAFKALIRALKALRAFEARASKALIRALTALISAFKARALNTLIRAFKALGP